MTVPPTKQQQQKQPNNRHKAASTGPAAKPHASAVERTTGPSKPEHRSSTNSGAESAGVRVPAISEKARGKRPAHKPPAQSSPSAPSTTAAATLGGSAKGNGHERGTGNRTAPANQTHANVAPDAETRARLVREHIARLREQDGCAHSHWRTERGAGRCDTCHHDLRLYIFVSILSFRIWTPDVIVIGQQVCTDCQVSACNRCRRNRL